MDWLSKLFGDGSFMPHGYCLRWDPLLLVLLIVANIGIALAYFSIPISLLVFVARRKDLAYSWMFKLFSAFIICCGLTHMMKVVTIYKSTYLLEGLVDLVTALVSLVTAVLLVPLIPKALAMRSPKELDRANQELAKLNQEYSQLNTELEQANESLVIARDEALQSSNLKSLFVANISHELRTPLSGILGMNELLLRTSLSEEQRELANGVQVSSQTLLAIVNDILDLSKIEAGKLELHDSLILINVLLEEVHELFSSAALGKGLSLRYAVDPRLREPVMGDRVRLRQILVNLINNAIKFTDKGTILVTAMLEEWQENSVRVKFSVIDTGIGIDDIDQSRVFFPFTQADASSERRHFGAGLGLTICKQLSQLMGGNITLTSNPGVGSTFCVVLPFKTVNAERLSEPPAVNIQDSYLSGKVLVVEDDTVLQKLAVSQLSRMGVNAQVVGTGADALLELSKNSYDLVLMDCNLPGMDGFAATAEFRAREAAQSADCHLPIIAMTAGAMSGDREKCLVAGMDDYISKPYTLLELRRILEKWLPVQQISTLVAEEVAEPTLDLSTLVIAEMADISEHELQVFMDEFGNSNEIKDLLKNDFSEMFDRLGSCTEADLIVLSEIAHKLKGMSGSVGMTGLCKLAGALESAARQQDVPRCLAVIDKLLPVLKEVVLRIKTY